MSQRRAVIDVALGVLLVSAVASTFAPWLRSGDARRSSYQVVRTVERLELVGPTARTVGRIVWATLPLVGATALLALALERRSLAGALALWVAGAQALLAGALTQAPQAADWGVGVALALAIALGVAGLATLVGARRTP